MSRESLADRLMNYSDGLVAATFVFMTGIAAGIGDEDMRCSIGGASTELTGFVVIAGAAILFSLRWLRLWSERLRATLANDPEAAQLQSRLHFVRVGLTAAFLGVAIFLLTNAPTQEFCGAQL
ncbi:MAG: hypothetical protein AB8G23_09870 [Myxococcota bacterium]